jgi:hypothetical protein
MGVKFAHAAIAEKLDGKERGMDGKGKRRGM